MMLFSLKTKDRADLRLFITNNIYYYKGHDFVKYDGLIRFNALFFFQSDSKAVNWAVCDNKNVLSDMQLNKPITT